MSHKTCTLEYIESGASVLQICTRTRRRLPCSQVDVGHTFWETHYCKLED